MGNSDKISINIDPEMHRQLTSIRKKVFDKIGLEITEDTTLSMYLDNRDIIKKRSEGWR